MTRKISTTERLIAQQPAFQRALLAWYGTQARALPWRESPSVYKTVVSEFMLQQTQVKTVLPFFARWLVALPDFDALAAASEGQVLRLWEGLGYYSRARNLQRLARAVVSRTALPRSSAEWRELPGVGPYTAAAITSISFNEPIACVDGNVVRILARLTANGTEFRDSSTAAKVFAPLAQALLRAEHAGTHNQAMMELGATVCYRKNPLCLTCPVRPFCAAAQQGNPEAYPRLTPKQMEQKAVTRIWCEQRGALLLHLAADSAKRFANMHELPLPQQAGLEPASAVRGELLATKRRSITRFQIVESIYHSPPPRGKLAEGLVWVPLAELEAITLSGPHRRWVSEILTSRLAKAASAKSRG